MEKRRVMAIWLFVCCFLVFSMVVLGGVTRLTGSGLSMVRWEPVVGVMPPTGPADWQRLFTLYQQSPEYRDFNRTMDLEGFKGIFWLEYLHRLLGRMVGVVFFLPFLYFLARKWIDGLLARKLLLIFLLGGMQGLMGWLMVASGLVHEPHVSHYRLTAHLALALWIHLYMFWVGLSLWYGEAKGPWPRLPVGVSGLALLTALSGGLVAGLKAGWGYNTFPLMDGRWFPEDYFLLAPAWRNLLDNAPAVQWDHRLLAVSTLLGVFGVWWGYRSRQMVASAQVGRHLLLAMALLQVGLGIATLLLLVPIPLASAHQTGAVVLLTLAVYFVHRLRGTPLA